MSEDREKRWYPGKFYNKYAGNRRGSATRTASTSDRSPSDSFSPGKGNNGSGWKSFGEDDPREHSFVDIPSSDLPTLADSAPLATSPYKVRVKISESKYLRILQPKFSVRVGSLKISSILENQIPFERTFDLQNIINDIKIEVKGSSTLGAGYGEGVIFIPAVSLISFSGAALPPVTTWREIFPVYDRSKRCDDLSTHKFVTALPEIPGTGMSKAKFSLGFLLVEAEIIAPGNSVLGMYLRPASTTTPAPTEDDIDPSEALMVVQQGIVQRDIERLRANIFRIPAIVTAFLYFPEVIVLITAFGCLCFSLSAVQLPLAGFFLLLLNGILTNNARSFSGVTVWNEPGLQLYTQALSASDDGASTSIPGYAAALLRANQFILNQLSFIVHELEIFHNLLTFADPRISLITYGALFGASFAATIWLALFPVSPSLPLCPLLHCLQPTPLRCVYLELTLCVCSCAHPVPACSSPVWSSCSAR